MAESTGVTDVTVKTLDSQSRSYKVRGELTVRQFKEHIASSVDIPVDKQRLIYQGRVLQDDRTLTMYNVDGKVIHLVERAPPQTTVTGSGGADVSNEGEDDSSSHVATSPVPPQERNGNSYVMLGTFNLPVNIMEPQMSAQQMMPGVGESERNARVSTSAGRNGSVDVRINLDQSVQSEARVGVQLAENLLRHAQILISRLEGDSSSQTETEAQQSSSSLPASSSSTRMAVESQSMETEPSPSSSSSTSTQTEGAHNTRPNHPSPAEFVEILSEVRRVEERLRPFIERTHSILGAATSADYNNNTQERDEDQRVLNMAGDALRLLGNALVILGDLRCNLATPPPRHLYVVRPMAQYTHPVLVQSGLPHTAPPINVGTTATMLSNGGPAGENQRLPSRPSGQSAQQTSVQAPPPDSNGTNHHQEQEGPRVIRITHQTMEPVVMMHMNIDGDASSGQPNAAGSVQPGLPPEFMQAIVQQISHQAATMAAAASSDHQTHTAASIPAAAVSNEGIASTQHPPPPQARVVFTRPSFSPHIPQHVGTRGATINLRAMLPTAGQQAAQGTPLVVSSLTQMISNLVGQLLMPENTGDAPTSSSLTSSQSSFSTSSESSTSPVPPSANTAGHTPAHSSGVSVDQPVGAGAEGNLAQLLGSLLAGGSGSGPTPSITVMLPGAPGLFQSMTDFMSPPASSTVQQAVPQFQVPHTPHAGSGAGGDSLSPELFTGIVQGVLSTMMSSLGAQQGNGESIAQFIQRLSQTSNLFTPGSGDAVGFFGDLLSLVCQSFSMVDMVLLLHGNAQPLTRIQPQLTDFFTNQYMQGQEPTDANIVRAAADLISGLEEYITESFASVTVREGVDIVQTNLAFLRQQVTWMASHTLRRNDHTFGPYLLLLCTRALFECLALNLYCLRGEQRALTAVINHRIRRMSSEMNPSLVNWLTSMMSMRLHAILEHNPVTEDQIQRYVRFVPTEESLSPATTADEAMASSGDSRETTHATEDAQGSAVAPPRRTELPHEVEPWAASVPPEWVPIIRHDMVSQRKIRAQPPLSDAYLHGMPAKRRKMTQSGGPHLSLSDAVSRAARSAGALPVTTANGLKGELENPDLQDAYATQVKSDIKVRVQEDPDYNAHRFPNTRRAFSLDDS
ncbi:large proline-rich protein BAG6 isoform X1 [Phyllopteryx taeniolatus]|uniref:large proline-rich protein BAG6 isoform X1 n=1 Tax=Phyllopteryx taeniolatus TaxID=161469 RepID=UPI002AD3159B|nr:large proline-rich protein BAG6 isoform X1 [Phyllopteryx taeniolatus]